MKPQTADTSELISSSDLKPLAAAEGPCITAAVALTTPAELDTRVKNAIRAIEKKLAEREADRHVYEDLLAPIRNLAAGVETNRVWSNTLVVLRSPSLFHYYFLHGIYPEMEIVGDRFEVRPLLQALAHETRCYLLALSRDRVRLLFCNQHRAEPVETGKLIPHNLAEWMNHRQPDHRSVDRSSAGPSEGRMKGVVSGTGKDNEQFDENLAHFFKEAGKGVATFLHGQTVPLLLAGVEREVALYRRENSYAAIWEQAVAGSPDGMSDRELHHRAMAILAGSFTEPLRKVTEEVRQAAGSERCPTDPRAVVQAAFQGRVMELLVAANAEYRGAWNEEWQDVDIAIPRQDLLNDAALEVLAHGGRAWVLPEAEMPVAAPAAALLRF